LTPSLIDTDALASRVDPLVLVDALRRSHASGRPPDVERLLMTEPGTRNDLLVWGGWRRQEGVAVKAGLIFPGNAERDLPNIRSVVLLFDGDTAAPLAVFHGESFTRMKTAADSALAAQCLAREDCDTLAVIGAGAQAEVHVAFLMAVRPSIRRVLICNRTPERAEALAATLRAKGVAAEVEAEAETAVRQAGLVTCLTAARTPVLAGRWLAPGTHVDLVGGFTPEMRESDDETVRRGRLFADTREFTVATCGDFARPLSDGVIGPERIEADLFELASGAVQGRREREEITVFKNGGGGHLDLMVARALFDIHAAAR
jgi:ornithine cyclodeaminase/alanine dehydrogenase-like protein (mu-crystallin family)